MPTAPVYAASKAGLIHLAQSLAPRLAKRGIRVCTICPQGVDTPLVILQHPDFAVLIIQQLQVEACMSSAFKLQKSSKCRQVEVLLCAKTDRWNFVFYQVDSDACLSNTVELDPKDLYNRYV